MSQRTTSRGEAGGAVARGAESDTEPPHPNPLSEARGDADTEQAAAASETLLSPGYIDCLQYCLEHHGQRLPKALLMGISGESFRLCFDRTDPTRGLEVVSHNPLRAACGALGYDADVVYHRDLDQGLAGLAQALAERGCAILHADAGWVVAQRDESAPEHLRVRVADGAPQMAERQSLTGSAVRAAAAGVVTWSLARLREVWRREPGLLELGLEGYYYFVIGDKEREPEGRESAMGSLRRGVRLLMRKSRIDGCSVGLAAYDDLQQSLLQRQRGEARLARSRRKYALWSAVSLPYVRDSRRSAISYLTMIQPDFDEDAVEHLRKAAEHYAQAVQALEELPAVETPADAEAADPAQRRAERRAIRRFALLRRRAVGRLRRAQRAEDEALLEIRRALEAAERQDE